MVLLSMQIMFLFGNCETGSLVLLSVQIIFLFSNCETGNTQFHHSSKLYFLVTENSYMSLTLGVQVGCLWSRKWL